MIQQKRYPNLKAFTANEQHLFFGREREKEELHQLVVLHNIVVIFAASRCCATIRRPIVAARFFAP